MHTRNFCIIAHIDHGKSTLADRLIEITQTVEKRQMREQLLDQMDIERERGITIKLQPIRLQYKGYVLNLIDTPGHVDFQYEVGRSLAAVEGAILLVDATQGIQAQTLSTLYAALDQNLTIIPAVNKIDLPAAKPEETATEIANLLGVPVESVLFLSGKTGEGVSDLLQNIIDHVPSPKTGALDHTRALVFDSLYDSFRGVIAYVRVTDGEIRPGDTVHTLASKEKTEVAEVGTFAPHRLKKDKLVAGDIGYVVTQFRDVRSVRVGDTLADHPAQMPLPGYKQVTPVVFASLFSLDRDQTNHLREALEKLALNDAALTYVPENNAALGSGFRCGFLGALHLDIVRERLEREAGLELIATTPTVAYEATLTDGSTIRINTPEDFPDPTYINKTKEPIAEVEIIVPSTYVGAALDLIHRHRGQSQNTSFLDPTRALITALIPLSEIIITFHDELKSSTAGYGSFSYQIKAYKEEPLVKLEVLLAGESIPPLSQVIPAAHQQTVGRQLVERLKELLPPQSFAVPVQAAISGKVIARETIPARRKDVTAKLYGGDVTRKRKLLEKQKKGKKRLAQFGQVEVPPSVFFSILKRD